MDTFDVLPSDLLKGTGDYCLGEDITQNICIVDVLCALPDTKYGDFLRQMLIGKQRVATTIGRDRLTVPRVSLSCRRAVLIIVIDGVAAG